MRSLLVIGWQAFARNYRICLLVYITKLLGALVVTLPILFTIQSVMSNSLYATPLMKEWSLSVIGEVIARRPFLPGHSIMLLIVVTVLIWVVRMFLNGGIYRAFAERTPIDRGRFFTEAARGFGIHVRISGLMVIFYLIAIGLGLFVGSIGVDIVRALLPEAGAFALACRLALLGIIVAPAIAFSDSMRAVSVNAEVRTVRTILPPAFSYFSAHWVQLTTAYIAIFAVFVGIWAGIELLALTITGMMASTAGIMIELLLFQLCSFLRVGQSLWFTASVTCSYQSVAPRPIPETVIEVAS